MYIINFRTANSPVAEGWNPKIDVPPTHPHVPLPVLDFSRFLPSIFEDLAASCRMVFPVPQGFDKNKPKFWAPPKKKRKKLFTKIVPKTAIPQWISEPHAAKGLSRTRFMTISTRSGVKQHHIPPSQDSSKSGWCCVWGGEIDFPHLVVAIFWKDFLFKIGKSYRTFILSLLLDGG